jgi:hypothetical protein
MDEDEIETITAMISDLKGNEVDDFCGDNYACSLF